MSAGELEAEWAGEPGRLVRRRYRKAAEIIKNAGVPSCLIVHDIDAGAGRFKKTQATVNTQMVMGTLMNLCDHPNRYLTKRMTRFTSGATTISSDACRSSTGTISGVGALLLRDGRMEKYYWSPTREDVRDMVHAMFKEENDRATIEPLVDEHPGQPLISSAPSARACTTARFETGSRNSDPPPQTRRPVRDTSPRRWGRR